MERSNVLTFPDRSTVTVEGQHEILLEQQRVIKEQAALIQELLSRKEKPPHP